MLTAVWFHKYTLLTLLLFISTFALSEFFSLVGISDRGNFTRFNIIGGWLIITMNFFVASGTAGYKWLLADIAIILLLQAINLFRDPDKFTTNFVSITSGLFYVLLPLSLIPFICFYDGYYDYHLLFGFFILLWTYDSFAYITGVLVGRHRIMPSLSPKKSWEGFGGGLIFAISMSYVASLFFSRLTFIEWAGLAVIIVITATAGDFIESAMKRNAAVKDSGKFLPGHGGILDRFDSVLFSVPFVYLYLSLLIS